MARLGLKFALLLTTTLILVEAVPVPVVEHKTNDYDDFDFDLSPKLMSFLERLLTLDPKLIETGETRLEERQRRFGVNQLDEILTEATSEERTQFFEALEGVEKLYEEHPIAKQLIENLLATSGKSDGLKSSSASSEEFFEFFKEFSQADKELSSFPEWNRYWNIWFKKHVDYMTKYG